MTMPPTFEMLLAKLTGNRPLREQTHELSFWLAKLAILFQRSHSRQSCTFTTFLESAARHKGVLSTTEAQYLTSFFEIGEKLCELEAMTFLNEEQQKEYAEIKMKWQQLKIQMSPDNEESGIGELSADEFRQLCWLAITQREWCSDVAGETLSPAELMAILPESPVFSIAE